ncbi:tape measure protein [Achromobacter aloeverae]
MTIARELVTLLRYQLDESGLTKYEKDFENAQQRMQEASRKTVKKVRDTLVGVGVHPSVFAPKPGTTFVNPPPAPAPAAPAVPPGIPSAPPAPPPPPPPPVAPPPPPPPPAPRPAPVSLPSVVPPTGTAGVGVAPLFPVNVPEVRAQIGQVQTAYAAFINRARAGFNAVRQVGGGAMEGVRLAINDAREAQAKFNAEQQKGADAAGRQEGIFGRLRGMVGQLAAAYSAVSAAHIADEWSSIEARVGLATDSVDDQKTALEGIYKIAQDTRQQYGATADLFTKISQNSKDLGLGLGQSLDLTKTIGQLMVIGGGSREAQQAALMQLGQSLGSGVLRGDELQSVVDQAPRLAKAIADTFGVPVAKLKDLGSQGKLTSKELAEGLLKQADKINAEFARMPMTFSGGWTVVTNALHREIHEFDKASAAARIFGAACKVVAENMHQIVRMLGLLGASYAMNRFVGLLARARGQSFLLLRAFDLWKTKLAPLLRMAAILYAIYLIGDDIMVWLRGGDSELGALIGKADEWKDQIDAVSRALKWVKDALGGGAESLGQWLSRWGAIALAVYGVWRLLAPVRGLVMFIVRVAVPLLWRAFVMTPIGQVVALVVGGIFLIWKYWDTIIGAIAGAWDRVRAAAQGTVFEPIIGFIEEMFSFWKQIIGAIVDVFTGNWSGALDKVKAAFKGLGDYWSGVGAGILKWIQDIGNAIGDWITSKIEAAKKALADLLPDWAKDGYGAAKTAASGIAEKAGGWWDSAKDFVGLGGADAAIPQPSAGSVQRSGMLGRPITIQQTVGSVQVNAPSADPAAVAGATTRGIDKGLSGAADAFQGLFTPGVEWAP